MAKLLKLISLICLTLGLSSSADAADSDIPDLSTEEAHQWRQVDNQMESHEYRDAIRNNQRLVRNISRYYLENELISLGVSKKTIKFTGATIGFLVNGARFNLNESKTMMLELRDVAQREPALIFKLHFNWQ